MGPEPCAAAPPDGRQIQLSGGMDGPRCTSKWGPLLRAASPLCGLASPCAMGLGSPPLVNSRAHPLAPRHAGPTSADDSTGSLPPWRRASWKVEMPPTCPWVTYAHTYIHAPFVPCRGRRPEANNNRWGCASTCSFRHSRLGSARKRHERAWRRASERRGDCRHARIFVSKGPSPQLGGHRLAQHQEQSMSGRQTRPFLRSTVSP